MIRISDLTDKQLESFSTERLTDLAFAAGYSGTDEDARRVGRVLRSRRQYREVTTDTTTWSMRFDPDDWMGEDLMKD
jgi:hypothetical protein